MNFFEKLISTFDTETKGFSARKITAFWFIVLVTYVHYQHLHESNSVDFLLIDAGTALLLLSVNTVQDLINLRAGTTTVNKQEITIKETKTDPIV